MSQPMHVSHTIASIRKNCSGVVANEQHGLYSYTYVFFRVWNQIFLLEFYIVRKQSPASLQFMRGAEDRSAAVKLFLFKWPPSRVAEIELSWHGGHAAEFCRQSVYARCVWALLWRKSLPRYVLKWNLSIAFGCIIITLYLTRRARRRGWNFPPGGMEARSSPRGINAK